MGRKNALKKTVYYVFLFGFLIFACGDDRSRISEVGEEESTSRPQIVVQNLEEARALLEKYQLTRVAGSIEKGLLPSIRLDVRPATGEAKKVGGSRLGGWADLPSDFDWPKWDGRPLSFVAQINLSEVSPHDTEKILPASGILHFFYDLEGGPWGGYEESEGWRVTYFDGNTAALQRTPPPRELGKYGVFRECSVEFRPELTFPECEPYLDWDALNEKEQDQYVEVLFDLQGGDSIHRLLGHAAAIQDPDMQLQCQLYSHNVDYHDPRRAELEKGKDDWILLLQIDSDARTEMMWGDWGRIYFYVRKQDLQERNFGKVWMILQCT
jgi:uncharacterized protein YwqG